MAEDPLAEAGNEAAHPIHPPPEKRTIGSAIEQEHGGDRASEQRILLDAPHQRVGVAHAGLELDIEVVLGHQHRTPSTDWYNADTVSTSCRPSMSHVRVRCPAVCPDGWGGPETRAMIRPFDIPGIRGERHGQIV